MAALYAKQQKFQHVFIDDIVLTEYIPGKIDPSQEEIMTIFVTGATGFIGSAIVQELINAGHQVLGLARSEGAAKSLAAAGAGGHQGSLQDLDSLRSGAAGPGRPRLRKISTAECRCTY